MFNSKYLPKSDVVFTVMFLNKDLCERTLEIVTGEKIELKDIVAEYKNDIRKAALNSIFFDIRTESVDGRIITLDLQRKYSKNRIRKRTVYYACREIANQAVEKGHYEELKSVAVSFILTEAGRKTTSERKRIMLKDDAGEVYSDLLSIYEIGLKNVDNSSSEDMLVLRDFFGISNENDYNSFCNTYSGNAYAKLLIECYMAAVRDDTLLDVMGEEEKFMIRLSEEDRLEERNLGRREGEEKGRREGRREGEEKGRKKEALDIALNMVKMGMNFDIIFKLTGITESELK